MVEKDNRQPENRIKTGSGRTSVEGRGAGVISRAMDSKVTRVLTGAAGGVAGLGALAATEAAIHPADAQSSSDSNPTGTPTRFPDATREARPSFTPFNGYGQREDKVDLGPTPTQAPEASPTAIATEPGITQIAQLDTPLPITEIAFAPIVPSNPDAFTAEELEKLPTRITYTDMYGENPKTATVNWSNLEGLTDRGGDFIFGFRDQLPNIDPSTLDYEWLLNGREEIPIFAGGVLIDVSKTSGETPNPVLILAVPIKETGEVKVVHVLISQGAIGARFITINPATGESMGIPESTNGLPTIPWGKDTHTSIKWSAEHDAVLFPTGNGEVSSLRPGMPLVVRGTRNIEISGVIGESFVRHSGGRRPDQWLEDLQDNNPANDGTVLLQSFGLVTSYNPKP
jgi:hypothetical protein